ncbi:ROK family glucokinase [Weissella hellenica]|uniref:Glucokinase n=1 Tax=Weissella hellenica TaxID=46256 RepID=A0A4Y4G8I8_WEIHE|nr:ROK family glucokinase [Weissella hellenica]NKY66906.1 ROK family glucokinase [Weissella hellenica]GED35838.1 glucokinase [Weissella hellenica]SCB88011.1 glucokinase [Weissella hellenica]
MAKDKLIGIDLGGTTIKFAIMTATGDIQQKWSIKTNIMDEGSHIVPDIITSINYHLDLYQLDKERIIGVGMGTPGTVDEKTGTVQGAFNLNWKEPQHVKADLEAGLGFNVAIDNDANAAALGEQWRGAGNNQPEVVFVTLGTGVGGGIVNYGKLVHGAKGAAGEIGHMIVEPGGYLCTCGNYGCLEQYTSATGIVRLAHDYADAYAGDSKLKSMVANGDEITSKIVFDLAQTGDYLANEVVDKVSFYLGLATANIANILNPSAIVIGGGVSAAGDFLLNKVKKNFQDFAFKMTRDVTEVKLAELGNDAGAYGAASLALQAQI